MKKQVNLSSLSPSLQREIKREVLSKKRVIVATDEWMFTLPRDLRKSANFIAAEGMEKTLLKEIKNVLDFLKGQNLIATKLLYEGEVDRYDGWMPTLTFYLNRPLTKKDVTLINPYGEEIITMVHDCEEGKKEVQFRIDAQSTQQWEEGYDEDYDDEDYDEEAQAAIKKELAASHSVSLEQSSEMIEDIMLKQLNKVKRINQQLSNLLQNREGVRKYSLLTDNSLDLVIDDLSKEDEIAIEKLGFYNTNVGKGQPRMFILKI